MCVIAVIVVIMLSSFARRSSRLARAFHTASRSLAEAPVASESSSSAGAKFSWNHLVTPYTAPDFIARMKSLDQSLAQMRAESFGAPETVEPIQWAEWEAKIDDKAQVRQIKESYTSFKPPTGGDTSMAELDAQIERAIKASTQSKEVIDAELAKYREELARAKQEKPAVHNWHFHDYMNRYPGLAEQMRAQYMAGYQLPTDAEDRLQETDIGEFKKAVKAGSRVVIDEELSIRVGDYDLNAELAKTEELVRKLFGESANFSAMQAEIQREIVSPKVDEVHHAEEH